MKMVNVALTDSAHDNLKALTESTKKNQSDILSFVLERIDVETTITELNKPGGKNDRCNTTNANQR